MIHNVRCSALLLAAGLAAAASLALAPMAQAANLTPQEEKLIRDAKKEGAVTVINPLFSDPTAKDLGPAFIKLYGLGDGFKFNNLRKGTGATVAQVRQEIKAGKFTVDVHIVSAPGFFHEAAKQGAFAQLDSGHWKEHEAGVKAAGQYSNYPFVVTPFAYTFAPVWNTSCPGMENVKITSLWDTVDPKLAGKTISPDITKSITYTNTVIGLAEAGVDINGLWDKLKATKPIVEFRTEPKMQMVVKCERPIDMFNLGARVFQHTLQKPELRKVIKVGYFKEGQVMLGNQAVVLKGGPHPNAGKLFIEFLLRQESADILAVLESVYSFRKGWKVPAEAREYMYDLGEIGVKSLGLKDWLAAAKQFDAVRGEWTKRFK